MPANEDVFGVRQGDRLPALPGWLASGSELEVGCRALGASGDWDEAQNTFQVEAPSWISVVAELLGPELAGDPSASGVLGEGEVRDLGPFRLGFLEALVVAADRRASGRVAVGEVHG